VSKKVKREITLEDIYKEVVKLKKLITGRNNRLTRDIRMWQRRYRRLQGE
jgi:hypothetical protein